MQPSLPRPTVIDTSVEAVRDWVPRSGKTNAEIARLADTDETTVRRARAATWNPRAVTLSAFVRLLPHEGWKAGDPIPKGQAMSEGATASAPAGEVA